METAALFQKGTKDALLTAVGAPYGYLVVEGYQPVEVLHLAGGREALQQFVGAEILNGDQAGELEAAMTAAGLPAAEAALYHAVASFMVPGDYKPGYTFKLCAECTDVPLGLQHGHGFDKGGDRVTGMIGTLDKGFRSCHTAARTGKIHVLDAVSVFQAMVAADLPANDEDLQARWAALPEETRRAFVDERSRALDLPVGGTVIITTEIVGPDEPGGGFLDALLGALGGRVKRRRR